MMKIVQNHFSDVLSRHSVAISLTKDWTFHVVMEKMAQSVYPLNRLQYGDIICKTKLWRERVFEPSKCIFYHKFTFPDHYLTTNTNFQSAEMLRGSGCKTAM